MIEKNNSKLTNTMKKDKKTKTKFRSDIIGFLIWAIVLPPLICILFKYVTSASVGPIVLLHFIASFLVLPPIIIACISKKTKRKRFEHTISLFAVVCISIVTAILIVNYFIWWTYFFGIMNYQM